MGEMQCGIYLLYLQKDLFVAGTVQRVDLFEVLCQYIGHVREQVVLQELQVEYRKNQVVAAGPDKLVPVVVRLTKLRNDCLTELCVFVEGEALADKV